MRLVKLSVQRFQCIESAEVEFGPGLNVLYGPNDLGKSSLVWALRAVLLLQHNSAQHEQFVTWHGGGEPSVALTFSDAENRYWRVTKVFGRTAGRSTLESSKDGRTFTGEANGRQVDEKVRKMLGWGINAPGGSGGPRGMPDTFLIQVLLADQDSVRKVLFDSSLVDDDGSGRARLTAALEALAQEPMFKKILDDAQAQHDKAFTPTGRPRKGSPVLDASARIKDLVHEHDELEAKLRETTLAEERLRELLVQRDESDREVRDAREGLATTDRRLALQRQRDGLGEQIERHQATIRGADTLRERIDATQVALAAAVQEANAIAGRARAAAAMALECELARDEARTRLDTVALGDTEGERGRGELEETRRAGQQAIHDAQRTVERAAEALTQARHASAALEEEIAASTAATVATTRAEAVSSDACREAHRAKQASVEAEQRFRDATSDDKVRARELGRAELHNRQLRRQAERAEHGATLRRVTEIRDALAKAVAGEVSSAAAGVELDAAKQVIEADVTRLRALDAARSSLVAQERCGRLRQDRAALAAASRTAEDAQRHRDRAARLRAEATALRAKVPPGVPTGEVISRLRAQRENLRVAEAQVAVGLSVTIRPRRAISLRSSADGAGEISTTTGEPVTLAAQRLLAIRIDELVDLEIGAGTEEARARLVGLRARWDAEAAVLLAEQKVDSVEALEALRFDADANVRAAEERHQGAEAADQRAEHLFDEAADAPVLQARIVELERELAATDRAPLEAALDQLGAGWPAAITRSLADVERERQQAALALDGARQRLARLEAQAEARSQAAEDARREATGLEAALPDASETEARAVAAIDDIERDLAAIEQGLGALTTGTTDEESAARAAVALAADALAKAEEAHDQQRKLANVARETAIQAATRVEGARNQARVVDTEGVWRAALASGAALDLDAWQRACAGADQRQLEATTALELVRKQLDERMAARTAAIEGASESLENAEVSTRSARATSAELAAQSAASKDETSRLQLALAELKTEAAGANLDRAGQAIADLLIQLNALGPPTEPLDVAGVEHQQRSLERLEGLLREAEQELAKSRGALEQVGGAIAREREREVGLALQQAQAREQEVLIEYRGWKLLAETMKETESAEGAHLGRALAVPVSRRFHELTGGRYGRLELGTHLESKGIQAAGELREIRALSAGTQDQLATLLRICIAQQLRSSIVLDDQLSQSDPERVTWFNAVLRDAAQQIQIVFITCRPFEVLSAAEMPARGEMTRVAAAGFLRTIDLTRAIRRFGVATEPGAELPKA